MDVAYLVSKKGLLIAVIESYSKLIAKKSDKKLTLRRWKAVLDCSGAPLLGPPVGAFHMMLGNSFSKKECINTVEIGMCVF